MAKIQQTGKVWIKDKKGNEREYLTVAYRVQQFRQNEKDKRIVTEIIKDDGKSIRVKATILDSCDHVLATGHAEEKIGSTFINETSALENAETSAIGRALACYGYIGAEFASADEVANALLQQQQFIPPQVIKQEAKDDKRLCINVAQNKLLFKILNDKKIAIEAVKKQFNIEHIEIVKTGMDNEKFNEILQWINKISVPVNPVVEEINTEKEK